MVLAIAAAAVAVLASVVVLALGKGGELAEAHPDHPPLPLPVGRPLMGTDVALLRLPKGLWGYHVGVTDEALRRMAYALTERDARVAFLQQQLAELQKALDTSDQETGDSWFAAPAEYGPAPAEYGPEPSPWVAPAEFGHASDAPRQAYGPRSMYDEGDNGKPFEGRHARSDTVGPEDR
ncbi:MAG: hypothetical protein JWN52_3660 [Actinomycetia bacterium]|jgi:hypothetical protein|nr:hypothetical protein [Actinomycetes bacterium]